MEAPRDLTVPLPGSSTSRAILSGALKRLMRDLSRLPRPGTSAASARALRSVLAVVETELAREPGRLWSVIRRPNVGTQVRVLRELEPTDPRLDPLTQRLAATLAVELAVAGTSLPSLHFETDGEPVVCLGGRFSLPGGAVTLRDGVWRVGAEHIPLAQPRERPHHPIAGAIVLALVDDNPLAMQEAHPDKLGNAIDLGARSVDTWLSSLRDALTRIERGLPEIRREADLFLHQIVPVGYDAERHLSASYREALGTIYLTLHDNPLTMTEAVVHELSHTKLNALLELDPLLENAYSPLYRSPVRPDPRPLLGVLLAVHAFLPIEALYRGLLEEHDHPDVRRRYEQIRDKNRDGAEVLLTNARATPVGRGVLDEIARLIAE